MSWPLVASTEPASCPTRSRFTSTRPASCCALIFAGSCGEGGGKVADIGRTVVAHGDGNHVEAAGHLAEALPLEVVLGEAHEPPPLPPLDRCRRGVPPARLAALHLDEHPGAAVTADQVELAEGEPHVALDNDEARAREEAR